MAGTIIVSVILVAVVAVIIKSMWRGKKSGKDSCGGECGRCRGCH